jgi:hypothetical protein
MTDIKTSAYMILYNDWDVLDYAINSARAFADELVVVDGAYKWMTPILKDYGEDAECSNIQTRAILDRHKDFVRYIPGIWDTESQKRIAAFEACKGNFIHLIDADEIHEIADDTFADFIKSPHPVAEMASPLLMPGGLLARVRTRVQIGRKPTTFKHAEVSAQEHLSYLWLVLPKSEQAALPPRQKNALWPRNLGMNYHYSMLRTADSAINRAMFYVFLRYLSPHATDIPVNSVARVLEAAIPPSDLRQILEGHHLTISYPLSEELIFEDACLPRSISIVTSEIERAMRQSHENHRALKTRRVVLDQFPSCIDVTDLRRSGRSVNFLIKFDGKPHQVTVQLMDRLIGTASTERQILNRSSETSHVAFVLPLAEQPDIIVRSMISIIVGLPNGTLTIDLREIEIRLT